MAIIHIKQIVCTDNRKTECEIYTHTIFNEHVLVHTVHTHFRLLVKYTKSTTQDVYYICQPIETNIVRVHLSFKHTAHFRTLSIFRSASPYLSKCYPNFRLWLRLKVKNWEKKVRLCVCVCVLRMDIFIERMPLRMIENLHDSHCINYSVHVFNST